MGRTAQNRSSSNDQARTPGKRRVTMSDIARAAGCSQATVSFVLNANDTVQISQSTRERVLRLANELGYAPPSLRGLHGMARQAPDGTIAYVIDTLTTSPEAIVSLNGITQAVKNTGNVVLAAETHNDPVIEPKTLSLLIEQQVSAIVYACIFTRRVELPAILQRTKIPVFLLNCYTDDMTHPAVVPSEIAGGQRAANALIAAGHKRIGTIVGEPFMDAARDRLKGYRRALATADIPFDPDLVTEGDWSASAGFRGTQKMLALSNPPTAIFCQNDRMAVGCYEALKGNGLRIPQDMSVVGYDDEDIARHLYPPLTTLILPHREMGRWVVEQFFEGETQQKTRYHLTKLECALVERDSIAPPPT